MADNLNWLVTVDHQVDIKAVASALTASGFVISQILDEVSCITGAIHSEKVPALQNIAGVIDISPDFPVQLDPIDPSAL